LLERPVAPGCSELIDADMDWERMSKPYELHFLLNRILDFYQEHKRLPGILDNNDKIAFLNLC
jgi:Ubiquitin-activating enzyme E1 four-helix bundle